MRNGEGERVNQGHPSTVLTLASGIAWRFLAKGDGDGRLLSYTQPCISRTSQGTIA